MQQRYRQDEWGQSKRSREDRERDPDRQKSSRRAHSRSPELRRRHRDDDRHDLTSSRAPNRGNTNRFTPREIELLVRAGNFGNYWPELENAVATTEYLDRLMYWNSKRTV